MHAKPRDEPVSLRLQVKTGLQDKTSNLLFTEGSHRKSGLPMSGEMSGINPDELTFRDTS